MTSATEYVIDHGITTDTSYPYHGRDMTCESSKHQDTVWKAVTKDNIIPENDNDELLAALDEQPVSVAIDALRLQFYIGGIIKSLCGQSLDHGVTLVGWGVHDNTHFWKIKNSWGHLWGEHGYFRVKRESGVKKSPCGVPKMANYASI